jgi:hypothetical protein
LGNEGDDDDDIELMKGGENSKIVNRMRHFGKSTDGLVVTRMGVWNDAESNARHGYCVRVTILAYGVN